MDRKEFLVSACTLCGLGLAGSLLDSCSNGSPAAVNFTLDLNNYPSLRNTGGYAINGNTIVMNTGSGYKALSLSCTHQGCTVNPINGGANGFQCPCHGATFSSTGGVTGGPAPSNLPSYTVTQAGTVLTIKG